MFIGGMMFGIGLCGMVVAGYIHARDREALENRLKAIEAVCFKSES